MQHRFSVRHQHRANAAVANLPHGRLVSDEIVRQQCAAQHEKHVHVQHDGHGGLLTETVVGLQQFRQIVVRKH